MRSYIKGLIIGIIAGVMIFSVPALADKIDVLFNEVRININGIDRIQWDESIELDDGTQMPASMLVNGTTYLPMRKISDLLGRKVYWNGDSKTVSVTEQPQDIKVLAEKSDKNGNVWKYYTFKAGRYGTYLGVKDEARGYERVYNLSSNVYVADDGVYFYKTDNPHDYWPTLTGSLMKISFDNDENSQDGERMRGTGTGFAYAEIIDDEYVYVKYNYHGNGATCSHHIYHYGESSGGDMFYAGMAGSDTSSRVYDIENRENEIILKYEYIRGGYIPGPCYEIVYDKATDKFGNSVEIEKRVIEETK